MLYKLVLYIILKNIQHIQSRYSSHTVPQWRSDDMLFAVSVPWSLVRGFWICF